METERERERESVLAGEMAAFQAMTTSASTSGIVGNEALVRKPGRRRLGDVTVAKRTSAVKRSSDRKHLSFPSSSAATP